MGGELRRMRRTFALRDVCETQRRRRKTPPRTYVDVVGVDVVRVGVSQEWVELDSVAVVCDTRRVVGEGRGLKERESEDSHPSMVSCLPLLLSFFFVQSQPSKKLCRHGQTRCHD